MTVGRLGHVLLPYVLMKQEPGVLRCYDVPSPTPSARGDSEV